MNSTVVADEAESSVGPWVIDTLTVVRLLLGLISLATVFWALLPALFRTRFVRVQRAVRALSKTKVIYSRGLPEYMLPRPDTMTKLRTAMEDTDYNTVLVYGERGSGKTTTIEYALGEHFGVKQWTLQADEGPAATEELHEKWNSVFLPWKSPTDTDFELAVCHAMKEKNKQALIVVLSVESSAKPAALKNVLHFCKTMSYNTLLVRFVVEISSSREAVALQTDLRKLRISGVFVGPITQPEAHSYLQHKLLPKKWSEPQIEAVSLEITTKFDLLLLIMVELCTLLVKGMSTDEAMEQVKIFHDALFTVALKRLSTFDTLLQKKIKEEFPENPTVPNLFQENPEGLNDAGIDELEKLLSPPVVLSIVSVVGAPYIFAVDPFTETVSLNGRIMKAAFVHFYKKKN